MKKKNNFAVITFRITKNILKINKKQNFEKFLQTNQPVNQAQTLERD